jgi:DNA-binding IclR family transcriptional regulator
MTEATADPAATAGRGRPRPESTIARDAAVLDYLKNADGPQSRKQIAEGTALPGNQVYLSLYRLSRAGEIHRDGSNWSVGAVAAEVPAAE